MNATEPMQQRRDFSFTGAAGEYFKIWIVNLGLSIVTLGIYSAWAKVRRKRYFYGNTWLDGAAFEYHANPISILKGRLIAIAAFVLYAFAGEVSPFLGLAFGVAFLGALPWIITRSLAFNARNSSYRNVRFDFLGKKGDAAGAFVLAPILIGATLGVLFPWVVHKQKRFVMSNHAFGKTQTRFHANNRSFYAIYGWAFAMFVLVALAAGIAATRLLPAVEGAAEPFGRAAALALVGVLVYAGFLGTRGFIQARLTNLVWASTSLEDSRFESRLEAGPLAWIYVSNALAILVTLGLLIPWAAVRTARYRVERLSVISSQDLNMFVAATKAKVESAGEELADMFDVEVAL
jgi:uncharacterized membrane protein YjgN (DUF898 family)